MFFELLCNLFQSSDENSNYSYYSKIPVILITPQSWAQDRQSWCPVLSPARTKAGSRTGQEGKKMLIRAEHRTGGHGALMSCRAGRVFGFCPVLPPARTKVGSRTGQDKKSCPVLTSATSKVLVVMKIDDINNPGDSIWPSDWIGFYFIFVKPMKYYWHSSLRNNIQISRMLESYDIRVSGLDGIQCNVVTDSIDSSKE